MQRFLVIGCACLLLVNVSGCGSVKGEDEVKELLKITTEAADTLEKEPAKAPEYTAKIEAAAKKIDDLKLSAEEDKKLKDKYKPAFDKLEARTKKK